VIGDVTLRNIKVDGVYENSPIGIFNYNDLADLTLDGVNITANSTRFNTSLNIDGITADIDFSDTSQFRNVKASIDPINLQGDPSDQEITGGNSGEFIRGRAGQDTLDRVTATTSSSATRT
jgi:hypothetical protein